MRMGEGKKSISYPVGGNITICTHVWEGGVANIDFNYQREDENGQLCITRTPGVNVEENRFAFPLFSDSYYTNPPQILIVILPFYLLLVADRGLNDETIAPPTKIK
jgi:hypothetical protein